MEGLLVILQDPVIDRQADMIGAPRRDLANIPGCDKGLKVIVVVGGILREPSPRLTPAL
jgi:hypothetical protein